MKEDLQALRELVQEIAKKYDIYIASFSFYGGDCGLSVQLREDKGTGISVELEED